MEHRITDFSGGFTDYPVDAKPNQMARLDNMLIDRDGKPYVRPGSIYHDATIPQIPAGAQKINAGFTFNSYRFYASSRDLYYHFGSSWNTLLGPSSYKMWSSNVNASNYSQFIEWKGHVFGVNDADGGEYPVKIYATTSGNYKLRTAGLPVVGNSSIGISGGTSGSTHSYVYQFYYYYEYTINAVTYADSGPITSGTVLQGAAISSGNSLTISQNSTMSNGTSRHYDTSAVKIKVYRTEDGGTVPKYVGEFTNGSGPFTDDVTDANLGDSIYTNGGVAENEPPPRGAKYIALTTNDILWYANVQDAIGNSLKYRIRQSIQYDLDSCPSDFYVDVDKEITGIGAVGIYPIVFTENSIRRLEGFFTSTGQGSIAVKEVDNSIGCISNNGIVPIRGGLLFPSKDGFYFTDGFKIQPVSKHIKKTYHALTSNGSDGSEIYGVNHAVEDKVYWSMNNSKILTLHTNFPVTEQSTFTSWSGGELQASNFTPTALLIDEAQGKLLRADTEGYIFRHSDIYLSDSEKDTSESNPTLWDTVTVDYDIITPSVSFGSEYTQKYCTHLVTTFTDATQTYIKPYSINDVAIENIDDTPYEFVPIKEISYTISDSSRIKTVKRRFPKKTMRCTHKSIRYRPADQVIAKSDDHNDATVSASGKTILLNNPGGYVWPTDTAGLKIYISTPDLTDDYQQYRYGYSITARSDDTLTLSDPDSTLEDLADAKWELRGPSDASQFKLLTIGMVYHPYGDGLSTEYQSGGDGGNS